MFILLILKTLLELDYDLISLDLNLLSRIQFFVGLTSHLHIIILHMTRAFTSTINLYNNPLSIDSTLCISLSTYFLMSS
jgi:hypothetical protein